MRAACSTLRVALLLAAAFGSPSPVSAQQPDIILIQTDDQPGHTMQFMPNVQQLIGDLGATFEGFYVSTSLCGPSRATTLTGQFSHSHGVLGNNRAAGRLKKDTALPTWLKAAGYRTALVGKYVNNYDDLASGGGWPDVPPGWDFWRAFRVAGYYGYSLSIDGIIQTYSNTPADYSTRVLTAFALDFLASPDSTPLFLYFTPYAPHGPSTPDSLDLQTFDGVSWGVSKLPGYNEADVSDKPAWIRALSLASDQQQRVKYEKTIESLQAVDRAVAQIVLASEAAAAARGRDLWVIYTSDNGFALGNHRWIEKWTPYESESRQPLLIRGSGVAPGTLIPATKLASNVDLAVTVADLAEATPTLTVDGASLVPLVTDPSMPWERAILLETRGGGSKGNGAPKFWGIVSADGWKWIEYDKNGERELYDLNTDPFEMQSLHADPAFADKRAELAAKLVSLKAPTPTATIHSSRSASSGVPR